jgi:hypothetical protein
VRTRVEVEVEMILVVADTQAAGTVRDEISITRDHQRLDQLLTEWQTIPLQRHPTP